MYSKKLFWNYIWNLWKVAIKMPGKGEALVKNVAVGINASDINFSAGAYQTLLTVMFLTIV